MTRPAADVINAILKNLEMVRDAELGVATRAHANEDWDVRDLAAEAAGAYEQAIALIRTEAADILTEGARP